MFMLKIINPSDRFNLAAGSKEAEMGQQSDLINPANPLQNEIKSISFDHCLANRKEQGVLVQKSGSDHSNPRKINWGKPFRPCFPQDFGLDLPHRHCLYRLNQVTIII